MAVPPSATPAPPERSGPGCLVLAVGLPLVVLVGVVVGTVLNRPDEPPEERSVTIGSGTIAGTEWRVDAVRDVEGDVCAFLFADGAELTGGCSLAPDDATFVDQTVVFGVAEAGATSVRVLLSNGESVDIPTVAAEGIDGRFYVAVVDGDVDAERRAAS